MLRDFAARFPRVALELRELTMPQQFEAFRRGDIDVGMLRPPIADAALSSEVIFEEPMILALPARHALAKLTRVPARRLADQPFVMYPRLPGLVLHDLIMAFCRGNGFTPIVAQEATQTHAVLGLVSGGLGIALVPDSVRVAGMRGVVFRPVTEGTPVVRTTLAWQRSNASPLIAGFVETARASARRFESGAPRNAKRR